MWVSPSRRRASLYLASPSHFYFLRLLRRFSSLAVDPVISTASSDDDRASQRRHPWPEWVSFVNRLRSKGYLEGDPGTAVCDAAGSSYTNYALLKRPCIDFANDYADIFKSLSSNDIQSVAQSGCPHLSRKIVNSAKKLRAYVGSSEARACDVCHLRQSCQRAYLVPPASEGTARTVDIMRILLICAVDGHVSAVDKHSSRDPVDVSSRKLLSELIQMSENPPDRALPKPFRKAPVLVQETEDYMDNELIKKKEQKKTGWACPECKFLNLSRNTRCKRCNAKCLHMAGASNAKMKSGDWFCPRCQFMNFASKHKCMQCQDPRPASHLRPGEWGCPSCGYLNFRGKTTCRKCSCECPVDSLELDAQQSEGSAARHLPSSPL